MYDFGEHEDAAYGAPYGIALGDDYGDDDYGIITVATALAISALSGVGAGALGAGALASIVRHGGPKHLQALATRRRKLKAKLKKVKYKWRKKIIRKRIKRINRAYKRLKARLKRKIARRKSKGKKLTKRQQRSLAIVQREQRRRKKAKARKEAAAAGTLLTPSLRHPGRRMVLLAKKMRAYDMRAFATYTLSVNRRIVGVTGAVIPRHLRAKIAFAKAIQVFPGYYKRSGTAKLLARIKATGPHTFRAVAQMGPSPYTPSPYTPSRPRDTPESWGMGPRPLDTRSGSFQFPPGSVSAEEYGPGGGQYQEEEGFSEEAEVGPEDAAYSDEGDYGEEAPFWKNPLVLGGAAIAAFLAYQQTQKGKKKSTSSSKKKASA